MINRNELQTALIKIIEDVLANSVARYMGTKLITYLENQSTVDSSIVTLNDLTAHDSMANEFIIDDIITRYNLYIKDPDVSKRYITAERPLIYIALLILIYGE